MAQVYRREAIENARAECARQGIEPDAAFERRLIEAAGKALILDDEKEPGKGRR